ATTPSSTAGADSSGTATGMVSPSSGDFSPAASSGTTTTGSPASFASSSSTSTTGTGGTLTSSTSSPSPSKPKPPPPPMPDALYILDANTATSVLSGVTQHSFSTWAMDLRAQVTGGTVQTYSWDLTNAPDATSVGGSSTYRLQF